MTYSQFAGSSMALAAVLAADIQPGDRIAVDAGDTLAALRVLFALWRLGAVPAVLPPTLAPGKRQALLTAIDPAAVVDGNGRIHERRPHVGHAGHALTSGLTMLCLTSGSTGEPKIVAHSAVSLLAGLMATMQVQAEEMGSPVEPLLVALRDGDVDRAGDGLSRSRLGLRFMSSSPIATMAGWTVAQRALLTGECLVIADGVTPDLLLAAVAHERVNCVSLTPFLAQRIARLRHLQPVDTNSLITVGIGGGPSEPKVVQKVEETLGSTVIVGYGSTETAGPVVMARPSDTCQLRWNTVGRPLPHVRCSIGRSGHLGTGGQGELLVTATSMMLGYWPDGLRSWSGASQDPVWHTGDLAEISDEGYVRIVGRISGSPRVPVGHFDSGRARAVGSSTVMPPQHRYTMAMSAAAEWCP